MCSHVLHGNTRFTPVSVKHDFESSVNNVRSYIRPLLRKKRCELPSGRKSLIALYKQNVTEMRVIATVIVFTASVFLLCITGSYIKSCAFKIEMLHF